ncbi:hypothetical protein SEA_RASPUTIA_14 [Microbacterium phage Rasputia]|nr:hypothetical protein SEA_RASPUTIA_14 [Microbacterium phage Rasputia]
MTTLYTQLEAVAARLSDEGHTLTDEERETLHAALREISRAGKVLILIERIREENKDKGVNLLLNAVASVSAGIEIQTALETLRDAGKKMEKEAKLKKSFAEITAVLPKIKVQGLGKLAPGKYTARRDPDGKENEYIVEIPQDRKTDFAPHDLSFIGTIHALDEVEVTYGMAQHGELRLSREQFQALDFAGKVTIDVKAVGR